MERFVEEGLLYDYYGALLTSHQQRIYELAVYQDLSLGEIAAGEKVSKQAVHDLLRRTTALLREYDEKLGLIEKSMRIRARAAEIEEKTDDEDIRGLARAIAKESY